MNQATTPQRDGTPAGWRAAPLWALLALAACSEARPNDLGAPRCVDSYAQGVGPVLQTECSACHSGALAEGDYRVDTYQAAIARRPDGTPRVSAGDTNSPLLEAARGTLPGGHVAIPGGELAELETWVVRCALKPSPYTHHINGWMDPGNTDQFHGMVLRQAVYNLTGCQGCHGADLTGGTAQVSCYSCHPSGVMACNTCHGNVANAAPPRDLDYNSATSLVTVGAHQSHVTDGAQHAAYPCEVCHTTPTYPQEPGHYQVDGKLMERPVAVIGRSSEVGTFSWNGSNATCTNSYCHFPYPDANASPINPVWTAVAQDQAPCGSCHGIPPAVHSPDPRCQGCHRPAYVDDQPRSAQHANGQVDLAAPPGSCVGCHGSGDSPAPPVDLLGRTDPSLRTVGAHRPHLNGTQKLSAPVACDECHLVPTAYDSPGHVDSPPPAKVFPPGSGALAGADNTPLAYDMTTVTCTTYCHGSGALLSQDTSPGINHAPVWNGGLGQVACGTCHGIPPQIAGTLYHVGVTNYTQCAACHPTTVTATGLIIVDAAGNSTHIDGIVEALPWP